MLEGLDIIPLCTPHHPHQSVVGGDASGTPHLPLNETLQPPNNETLDTMSVVTAYAPLLSRTPPKFGSEVSSGTQPVSAVAYRLRSSLTQESEGGGTMRHWSSRKPSRLVFGEGNQS